MRTGQALPDHPHAPHWRRRSRGFGLLRALRLLVRGVFAALLVLVMAAGILVWHTLPPWQEEVAIPGLSAPVDITLDRDGVPTIRAQSEADAAAALGFLHARDRMFQMELMRRGASGRLSEIAGGMTLRLDRMMRTLGIRHLAQADLAGLDADARRLLDAYAAGVNAWIAGRGRFAGAEFLLIGPPEPWTPVDTLLWGKTMGLYLSGNHRTELWRAALSSRVAPERLREIWPADAQAGRPEASLGDAEHARRLLAALPGFPEPFTQPDTASNAWAVEGRMSATGAPLLAGDPHLGFQFPSLWFLARIELPGRTLAGATAPGVPAIVLGHNGRVAWTFTTTHADSEDIFLERLAGEDLVETPDGPRPLQVRTETIRVRGGSEETIRIRVSRHGPIISDLDAARPADGLLRALASSALQPDDSSVAGLLALNRATSLADARRAAGLIVNPAQNLMVADRERIGLFVTGRIPIRRAGDGSVPVPGWDGVHDWRALAEGEALPRVIAPASGRLVNANERVAPPDFPVFLGRDWNGEWRARRIRGLLEAERQHTPATFTAIQMDVRSIFAEQVLPALRRVPPSGAPSDRALALLARWDGTMAEQAPEPLIFNAWIRSFGAALLREAGVDPVEANPSAEFLAFVLSPRGAHWCGGDCTPALRRALDETHATLAARHGPDPAAWRWGSVHRARFGHPFLRFLPVLGDLVGTSAPVGGDNETVFRAGFRGDFTAVHGASFRGVYDLADLERSLFMIAPGQSGHPASRLGTNLAGPWRDGTMRTLAPGMETAGTITLTPLGR